MHRSGALVLFAATAAASRSPISKLCSYLSRIDPVRMSRMRRHRKRTQISSRHCLLRPQWHGGQLVNVWMTRSSAHTVNAVHSAHQRSNARGNIMSATQFGLGLLYIAVAVICYAAGWWQAKTVERDRWEERAAAQDQLVQRDQQSQEPEVPVRRQLFERSS